MKNNKFKIIYKIINYSKIIKTITLSLHFCNLFADSNNVLVVQYIISRTIYIRIKRQTISWFRPLVPIKKIN